MISKEKKIFRKMFKVTEYAALTEPMCNTVLDKARFQISIFYYFSMKTYEQANDILVHITLIV